MTNRSFPVSYYQTLMEVFWSLRIKNLNDDNKCQKFEKKFQKLLKLLKFLMLKY